MQKRVEINNRKNRKIVAIVDSPQNHKGLVFVMHGLGGFKEQQHVQTFADAFLENGFTTVLFDTTNTFGESDGNYEDATVTNYYEDLEDVINWMNGEKWYQEPFWLAGHSTGGMVTALFAEKYPEKVKGLAPISTDVAGALCLETKPFKDPQVLKNWEKTGKRESQSPASPGLIKRLKWQYVPDSLKYDLRRGAYSLTMPVLMIVGEKDETTPLEHCEILYDKLPGPKELHTIKNAPHTFKSPEHLAEIRSIFDKWIKSNL